MESLIQGLKSISIKVYAFGGAQNTGLLELGRRLRAPHLLHNSQYQTTVQILNDGLPPRLTVEHENGHVDKWEESMNVEQYIKEIKFAKSLQEYKALFEEYAENDPDPMEEVIAQELERLKKKEEKERLEWEKKQIS